MLNLQPAFTNGQAVLFYLMRRIFFTCCILLGTSKLYAQSIQKKVELNLFTGYDRQDLTWSIAGNQAGQNPNIYSELKWKKFGGQSLAAALQWTVWNKIALTGSYSRTFINTGTVTDNDYNGDNRTNQVYDETFNADKGHTQAWQLGAGYILINNNKFSLTPFVGYGISRQSLHLLDRTGNFPDLNSTYQTDWKGPFIKAVANLRLADKLKLTANVTYNQTNYNAVADWNFIQTFQHPISYRHTAKGFGVDANASMAYSITNSIAINIGGGYYTWQTGNGVDELYLASGGSERTQLNGVDWKGYRLIAGVILSCW